MKRVSGIYVSGCGKWLFLPWLPGTVRDISLALHRGGTEYHSTNESPGPLSFRLLELSRLLSHSFFERYCSSLCMYL